MSKDIVKILHIDTEWSRPLTPVYTFSNSAPVDFTHNSETENYIAQTNVGELRLSFQNHYSDQPTFAAKKSRKRQYGKNKKNKDCLTSLNYFFSRFGLKVVPNE